VRAFALLALLLLPASPVAAEPIDFETQIKPILVQHCAKCHGAEKQAAKLALHDAAALATAEENGLLLGEDAENSEIYARLILEPGDKLLMPKGGKPLPAEQIELIKNWINQTASFAALTSAEAPMPEAEQPADPAADLPAVPPIEPASPQAIAAVEELGALVMPMYAGSNELRVSFPSGAASINDESLKAIVGLAPALVELDLHGSAITDAAAADLAQLVQLRKLHLENTQVGDPVVSAVAKLPALTYLNAYNTKLTDASLAALLEAERLERLYVWQTEFSYQAAKQLEEKLPTLEVNLGWNHPEVVRERLTAELERVTAQAAAADKQATDAQQMLDQAKTQKEAAVARQAEIEKELQAIGNPAGDGA
jgi:hypothetical protein